MAYRTDDPAAWVEIAREDLRIAQLSMGDSPPLLRGVLEHAQQAAEKFLKAYLVSKKADVPRTHDLEYLLDRCQAFDPSLSSLASACQTLNESGMPVRYPGFPASNLTSAIAQDAIQLAQRIATAIGSRL